MKYFLEPETRRTYSVYDIENQLDYFGKKIPIDEPSATSYNNVSDPSSSLSADTLESVLANTLQQTYRRRESYGSALSRALMSSSSKTSSKYRSLSSSHLAMINDQRRSNPSRYCSLIGKRVRAYSLSNQSTMAMTATASFSEEALTEPQETMTMDYENTYFHPEETTRLDDIISLTTITSNMERKLVNTQHEFSVCSDTTVFQSDTDESSDLIIPIIKHSSNTLDIQLVNKPLVNPDNRRIEIFTRSKSNENQFTGLVQARKYEIIEENSNEYEQRSIELNSSIRSIEDDVSLDRSVISSIQANPCSSPSNDQQKFTTKDEVDDNYMKIYQSSVFQPYFVEQSGTSFNDDENDDDSNDSSEASDQIRYTSDGVRHSCTSDELNNTSSTLRQEAISITKVRCKKRKTWIRSSSSPIQNSSSSQVSYPSLINKKRVDGRDVGHNASVNSKMTNKPDAVHLHKMDHSIQGTTILHNGSFKVDQEKNSNLLMSSSSSSSSINEKNLIDHQDTIVNDKKIQAECFPSLSPVKRLLNESIDSNIEIIQMDEQECVLEIVDGVLTIVPKEKAPSTSIKVNVQKPTENKYNLIPHPGRSSSIASSISSPSSFSEHEHEREEFSSTSSHSSSKLSPNVIVVPEQSSDDVLDLFSTPLLPISPKKNVDSRHSATLKSSSSNIPRSSSPIQQKGKKISPANKEKSPVAVEVQTRSNKSNVLSELLQTVKKLPASSEAKPTKETTLPKSEPTSNVKPINKDRINEFAVLLSSSVHLSGPSRSSTAEKQTSTIVRPIVRSEDQQNNKKQIDARYNEKIDDRSSIQVNTANIKALFEEKISTANRSLSQSVDHLNHQHNEIRPNKTMTKKAPVSYGSTNRHSLNVLPNSNRMKSNVDSSANVAHRFSEQFSSAKDVLIEEKQVERNVERRVRHESADGSYRARTHSSSISSANCGNVPINESLIAREIRENQEKEEELKRQRKQTVFDEANDNPKVSQKKNGAFLSNLDFFNSKMTNSLNESTSSVGSLRRSAIFSQNLVYDSQSSSTNVFNEDFREIKKIVSHELSRLNENGSTKVRNSSPNNVLLVNQSNNIIQREIEAIRAKEAELRELGRIQHTSDEHSDPRKYQEFLTNLTKSQSIQMLNVNSHRRETSRTTNNNFSSKTKPKSVSNASNVPNGRQKTAVNVVTSNESMKTSLNDRLELEKRQFQQREEELRKQRHLISAGPSSTTSSTLNSDSGNASQDEHDEDQERYFDKIERLKRTENQKAQAPLLRPTKKLDLSQKWEQMIANRVDH